MDQEPVHGLERDLRQMLVRPMDRIPSLEGDDAAPTALREGCASVCRIEGGLRERRLLAPEDRDPAGEITTALLEQACHAGMRRVRGPETQFCLAPHVIREDILDLDNGDPAPSGVC